MFNYRLGYLRKNEVLVLAVDGTEAKLDREVGPARDEDSQTERR